MEGAETMRIAATRPPAVLCPEADREPTRVEDHMLAPVEPAVPWPPKREVLGIQVTAADREAVCDAVMAAARRRLPAVVSAFAVHALIEAANARELGDQVNRFDAVTPDGQPLRWALNWLHGARLKSTVQGYELMLQLCARAAEGGVSVYLYGSSVATLDALEGNLQRSFPRLVIAGAESPPFRPLTPQEDAAMVQRVNASGAGLMFIGLGCPKQDYFAAEHAGRIQAVQLCVGAAFDFLAGRKPLAPAWMQRSGFAWGFRLYQEPKRLWKRYLVTNSIFIRRLAIHVLRQWLRRLWPRPLPAR